MTRILRIDASARHEGSVSRGLADRILARLDGDVTHRDLGGTAVPQVDGTWVGATFTPEADRTPEQREALSLSDTLVAELQDADVIVIATPIYNFGVPGALKAWADLVARVGVTFRYTENGPEGLLEGKRAIVAMASGGTQVGSEIDWASPWLRYFLGFIGIDDVEIVAADQQMMRGEAAVEAAHVRIETLAA
jgi:FMN-dependent NADH-azoreductase